MSNPVVLVTSGARGIGAGIAKSFLNAGYSTMVADIGVDADLNDWTYELATNSDIDALKKESPDLETCFVDVTNFESCEEAVNKTLAYFGQLDVLINNAGIVNSGPIESFDEEAWDKIFEVNTKGIFLMTKAALSELRKSKSASVINTASIAGVLSGVPFLGPYAVSKVGVVSISETLRIDLASEHPWIGISVLCPGNTATDVLEAERNRPNGREVRTEAGEAFRVGVGESMTGLTGQTADQIAVKTLDAVREGRFWIFTHPEMKPILEMRLKEILDSYPES